MARPRKRLLGSFFSSKLMHQQNRKSQQKRHEDGTRRPLNRRVVAFILEFILTLIYVLLTFIFFRMDIFDWVTSARVRIQTFEGLLSIFYILSFITMMALGLLGKLEEEKPNRPAKLFNWKVDIRDCYKEVKLFLNYLGKLTLHLLPLVSFFLLICLPILIIVIPSLASTNYRWLLPSAIFTITSLLIAIWLFSDDVNQPRFYYEKRLKKILGVSIFVVFPFCLTYFLEKRGNVIEFKNFEKWWIPMAIEGVLFVAMYFIVTSPWMPKLKYNRQSLLLVTALFIAIISTPNFFLGGPIESSFGAILVTFSGVTIIVTYSKNIKLATVTVCMIVFILSTLFPVVKNNDVLAIFDSSDPINIQREYYRSFVINDVDWYKAFQVFWVVTSLGGTLALSWKGSFNIFGKGSSVVLLGAESREKNEIYGVLKEGQIHIIDQVTLPENDKALDELFSNAGLGIFVLSGGAQLRGAMILEIGLCRGKLGKENICIFYKNDSRLGQQYKKDFHCIPMDDNDWKYQLGKLTKNISPDS